MIASVGIKRVVCWKRYHAGKETREIFRLAGVELSVCQDSVEEYDEQ